jgi:hypothetical protein
MVLIYAEKSTERLRYTLDYIFSQRLGLSYRLTLDRHEFDAFEGAKLGFGLAPYPKAPFFVQSSGFLRETGIVPIAPPIAAGPVPKLFPTGGDLGFDVFAAVFYMLSRYEEYLPYQPDEYGRFKAQGCFADKNGFLEIPVVDHWVNQLKQALLALFPTLKVKQEQFNIVATYDIDVAYAYKGRSPLVTMAAAGRDILTGKVHHVPVRIKAVTGSDHDPWDVYDELRQTLGALDIPAIFFFLVGDKSKYDRNLDASSPVMKNVVQQLVQFAEIGLHPSFYGGSQKTAITREKQRLETLTGIPVTKSRQHYLKFQLPHTYRELLASGIAEDFTMCFADKAGFRAGTCHPFFFYDLEQEKSTELKVHSATYMDGTFFKYMKYSTDEAIVGMEALLKKVKEVNGTFITIWHNHSISNTPEFSQWKRAHDTLLQKAAELKRTTL